APRDRRTTAPRPLRPCSTRSSARCRDRASTARALPGSSCRAAPRPYKSGPLPNCVLCLFLSLRDCFFRFRLCDVGTLGALNRFCTRRFGGQLGGLLTAKFERAKLQFDLAPLFFLALDVDAPAGQLGGKPDVLAFLADRQRQLLVFDDHFHHPVFVV